MPKQSKHISKISEQESNGQVQVVQITDSSNIQCLKQRPSLQPIETEYEKTAIVQQTKKSNKFTFL